MIQISSPDISKLELFYVEQSLKSGWITQNGLFVGKMESLLNETFFKNSKSVNIESTAVSNGTHALHLALLAAGVTTGDEVIIPNFCYVAVANAVLYIGAKPIFVDIDDNWCIDPDLIVSAITPRTKAIICVDNYGMSVNWKKVYAVVPKSIVIIQDAAESFPVNSRGTNIEIYGDICTISLYANKILTSGEGGVIISTPDYISKIRLLKNQSQNPNQKYIHTGLGFNYRITNMQAAFFVGQFERLEEIYSKRAKIFSFYEKHLPVNKNIIKNNAYASPWLFTIQLANSKIRQALINHLDLFAIETRPAFGLVSEQPHFKSKSLENVTTPKSLVASQTLISLPTHNNLSESNLKYICTTITDFLYANSN